MSQTFHWLTGDDELFISTSFIDSIQLSERVKHIVYISAGEDYSIDAIKNGSPQGQSAAHVVFRYVAEAKIRHGIPPRVALGGFSWTILGPSLFFDNDWMTKQQMIEQGIYGVPMGEKGVSRVGAADVALAPPNSLEAMRSDERRV